MTLLQVRVGLRVGLAGIACLASLTFVACDTDEPMDVAGSTTGALTVAELDQHVAANLCTTPTATGCLVVLTEYACANGGCPRVGYAIRVSAARPGRLEIHETHAAYLKLLREAVRGQLQSSSTQDAGVQGADTAILDVLYQQVQMTLRNYSARYYGAYNAQTGSWPEIPRATIFQDRTVDPARFHSVTFVNGAPGSSQRTAHAMVQADFGSWLATVAEMLATYGRTSESLYYLRLAQRVFASFSIPAEHGGVRNDKPGHRCLGPAGPYCYWFHSQPIEDYAFPSSPLNQNLHAIRDALEVHHLLRSWQQYGTCRCASATCARRFEGQSLGGPTYQCSTPGGAFPVGNEFDGFIAQLHDWGRGGLLNLAFASGNAAASGPPYPFVDESNPNWRLVPPPNLREFTQPIEPGFYRSSYAFWVTSHPGFARGRQDIEAYNNCHYHYHSMSLFAGVLALTDASTYFASDAMLTAARQKLLYDDESVTSCTLPASYPTAPLWQFVRAAAHEGLAFQADCPADVALFQDPRPENTAGLESLETARHFYDFAYCGAL